VEWGRAARQQALPDQAAPQCVEVVISLALQQAEFFIAGDLSDLASQQQVASREKAGKWGQIVGVGRGQRPSRVALGGPEGTSAALEVDDARRQNSPAREPGGETAWNRAEILSDHECPGPLALERKDAQEVARRISNVGSLGGRIACRDPVEPEKTHDVIDAKRTGVGECRSQHSDPVVVRLGAELVRIDGREAPVLAGLCELVRRRSDICPGGEEVRKGPCVTPFRGAADRQVAVDPNR